MRFDYPTSFTLDALMKNNYWKKISKVSLSSVFALVGSKTLDNYSQEYFLQVDIGVENNSTFTLYTESNSSFDTKDSIIFFFFFLFSISFRVILLHLLDIDLSTNSMLLILRWFDRRSKFLRSSLMLMNFVGNLKFRSLKITKLQEHSSFSYW